MESDTIISRSMAAYGEWTESEITVIEQLLKPGDNAIDVGANLGCHTVPMARAVSPGGTVLAFEPQPRIFQLLASNVIVNGLNNVRLFPMGCSAQPGTILFPEKDYTLDDNFGATSIETLRINDDDRSNAQQIGQRVQIARIDDVFDLERLSLIKIDVEGMEADVVSGAEQTIRRCRPIIFVENETAERSETLLRLISSQGYDLYWQIAFFYSPQNYRREATNVFGRGFCVNNICFPRERNFKVRRLKRVDNFTAHPRKSSAG
jgi:FkbM family methyltransferase